MQSRDGGQNQFSGAVDSVRGHSKNDRAGLHRETWPTLLQWRCPTAACQCVRMPTSMRQMPACLNTENAVASGDRINAADSSDRSRDHAAASEERNPARAARSPASAAIHRMAG